VHPLRKPVWVAFFFKVQHVQKKNRFELHISWEKCNSYCNSHRKPVWVAHFSRKAQPQQKRICVAHFFEKSANHTESLYELHISREKMQLVPTTPLGCTFLEKSVARIGNLLNCTFLKKSATRTESQFKLHISQEKCNLLLNRLLIESFFFEKCSSHRKSI
jgi:hypothetical protein